MLYNEYSREQVTNFVEEQKKLCGEILKLIEQGNIYPVFLKSVYIDIIKRVVKSRYHINKLSLLFH